MLEKRSPSGIFWFMNHVSNPLVVAALRSPLHGLLSSSLMLITYRGVKSGKSYTLPVQYARAGKEIAVVVGMPEQKTWWRNIGEDTPVELHLCGEKRTARATRIEGARDPEEAFRLASIYLGAFPGSAGLYGIRRNPDGPFDEGDLRRVSGELILLSIRLF